MKAIKNNQFLQLKPLKYNPLQSKKTQKALRYSCVIAAL